MAYANNRPRSGLGSLGNTDVHGVLIGSGGAGSVDPCDDYMFRLITPSCGGSTSSAPAPSAPTTSAPAPYQPAPYQPAPYQPPTPVVQTFDVEPAAAAAVLGVSDQAGGGGGGSELFLSMDGGGGAPTYVDVTTPEEPGPGFGMVEAGLSALIALLIAKAWQDRKR